MANDQVNQQHKTNNRYSHVKILTYDRLSYLIQFSAEKVIFFTSELLEQIQTVRSFHGDILTVATSSSRGLVFVFCDKEFCILSPRYDSQDFSIRWEKCYNQSVKESIQDGYSSFDDQYLITCSSHQVKIWNVVFQASQEESSIVQKIEPIFRLDVKENIKNVKFSPDSRYFTTLSEIQAITFVFVWNFTKILDNLGTYNEDTPQAQNENITNFALRHNHDVKSYKFRDSIKSPSQPFGPNTIVSVDVEGVLKVWQESPEDDSLFFHIHTVQLDNITNIGSLSFSFIYFNSSYTKKDLGYQYSTVSDYVGPYGILEKDEYTSLDWLVVLKDTSVDLFSLSHLRNVSKTSKVERVAQLKNPILLKYIRYLLYAQENKQKGQEYLEFYGQDYLGNLVKVHQNINQPNDLKIFISDKRFYGEIKHFSYDGISDSILTIDTNCNLCYQQKPHQVIEKEKLSLSLFFVKKQTLPSKYDFLSEEDNWECYFSSKIHASNISLVVIVELTNSFLQVKKIEHYKNYVLVFDEKCKVIEILRLLHSENRLQYQLIDIHDQAKEIFGLAYEKSSFEYSIKLISKFDGLNEDIVLEFLTNPLHTNRMQAVRFIINPDVFVDKKHFKMEVIYRYSLDSSSIQNFKVYSYNKQDFTFKVLTREEKGVTLYEARGAELKKLHEIKRRPDSKREEFIKYSGWVGSQPPIFYLITMNNDVEFYKEGKELLTKLNLKSLLFGVDPKQYDQSLVSIVIKHFYDSNFILVLENYLMLFNLQFDKRKQTYYVNIITTSPQSNQTYFKRFSRFTKPANYELIVTKDLTIIVKTNENVIRFNGFFSRSMISLSDITTAKPNHSLLPENFYRKIVSSFKIMPHHHPEFIYELISLGYFDIAQIILHKALQTLKQYKHVSAKFSFNITRMGSLFRKFNDKVLNLNQEFEDSSQAFTSRLSLLGPQLKGEDFFQQESEEDVQHSQNFLQILEKVLEEEKDVFGLTGNDPIFLEKIVQFLIDLKDRIRSVDFFSQMFIFHLQMFNNMKFFNQASKNRAMLTKEMVWAFHSEDKELIASESLGRHVFSRTLTWDILKKYGVPLWHDNLNELKRYIEIIAAQTYARCEKNPNEVSLWYILLKQKIRLANLYKIDKTIAGDRGKKAAAIQKLLEEDETLPAVQNKLTKNAFVLQERKEYERSASFYLIAGKLQDAVDIIIERLDDIQLAVLACRLYETEKEKPVLAGLIKTHFIESGIQANDIFLQHIGYNILGQHVNSVNALYQFNFEEVQGLEFGASGKKTTINWKSKFEPDLSNFHPSATVLAEKLRATRKVKFELDAENQKKHLQQMEDFSIFDDFMSDSPREDSDSKDKGKDDQKIELLENLSLHFKYCLQYYDDIKLPLLGLVFYQTHKNQIDLEEGVKVSLQKLVSSHIDFLIEISLDEGDHDTYFSALKQNLKELSEFTEIKEVVILDRATTKIQNMRSLQHSVSMNIAQGDIENAVTLLLNFCTQSQHLFFSLTFDNNLKLKQQKFWDNAIFVTDQLRKTINYIENSPYANDESIHLQLNSFKLYKLVCYFLINLGLEQFQEVNELQRKVINFCDKSIAKKQSFQLEYHFKVATLAAKAQQARELKYKGPKSRKFVDLFADAFPTTPYTNDEVEKVTQGGEPNSKVVDGKYKMILFSLLRYLSIKSLEIILSKYYQGHEKVDCQLDKFNSINALKQVEFYAKNQKKIFKALMKRFTSSEQNRILTDIMELTNDASYFQHTFIFSNLETYINPELLVVFRKELEFFDKLFSHLKTKIITQQFIHPNLQWNTTSENEKQDIFKGGIEILKIKQETLKGVCVNQFQAANRELICLTNRAFRKIDIFDQIVNKSRLQDGLALCEEDLFSSENLIEERKNFTKITNPMLDSKPQAIKLVAKLISRRVVRDSSNLIKLNKYRYTYLDNYTDQEVQDQIKYGSMKSTVDLDLYCIVSHPCLPIFFTGGRGIVEIWSCHKFMKITDLNYSSKDPIVSLKLSKFGEKVVGIDSTGSLYMWKFHKNTKYQGAFFSIMSTKQRQINDFCFLNNGSMIATVSASNFAIHDIILPPSLSQVEIKNYGGNFINYSSNNSLLFITSTKKGVIYVYDAKKSALKITIENVSAPQNQEVRCTFLNRRENVFVIGTNDGFIKLFELGKFTLVSEFQAFKQQEKKSVGVTQLFQVNESLFASSTEGTVQVVHPAIL